MAASPLTPVTVLTGFLGSGKTTLLNRLVRDPRFADTAIIVNEWGDIPIDHALVREASGNVVVLPSGCVCCRVAGDLVQALRELHFQRAAGKVPAFKRVVIETTGLADPAPLLATLIEMPVVAARYALSGVVATVDAEHGARTLDEEAESVAQAAIADRLVITKIDRAPHSVPALEARLRALNPGALVLRAAHGELDGAALFDAGLHRADGSRPATTAWLGGEGLWRSHAPAGARAGRHDADIRTVTWTAEEPLDAEVFLTALETLLELRGERILRTKGLAHFRGLSGPVAFHAVRHTLYPPARLASWPDEDRRTRFVFITRRLEPAEVSLTLDSFMPRNTCNPPPTISFPSPS